MTITTRPACSTPKSFGRIKGYKQMHQLVDTLRRHAHTHTVTDTESFVGAG